MPTDTQSRKYQLTINNPADHGLDHETLKVRLAGLTSLVYACLADEQGLEEQTPHTHIYFVTQSPVRFSTIKKRFPEAHIEHVHGTSVQNRDYVSKSGKWADDEKADTSIPDTFEEIGTMPDEPGQGSRTDLAEILEYIKSGLTNTEIMELCPDMLTRLREIDYARQQYLMDAARKEFRQVDVIYAWGKTETGKTRTVMEKYGYENVFRVTDYHHPFDTYAGQDVIVFDEFRGQFKIGDMLNYLDGYPLELPCRYANKSAAYTKAYIISNIDLKRQYGNVQMEEHETWRAFLRRIKTVQVFQKLGEPPIEMPRAVYLQEPDYDPAHLPQRVVPFPTHTKPMTEDEKALIAQFGK